MRRRVEVLFLRLIVGPLFGRFLDATGQKMTSLGQKMTSLGQKMASLLLSRVDTDLEAFWISKVAWKWHLQASAMKWIDQSLLECI